ncbi:MAG: PIN domain-containing protein [Candidatus Rokubacteria bacterium]|nr:PIN domain-containing protein [Candidatus Rokubacteria bacterium]
MEPSCRGARRVSPDRDGRRASQFEQQSTARRSIVARTLRRARQVQRLLAARGLRGRKVPDLLVAAAAEANGLAVLHYDADFDLIARVTGQPCAWIVPAGSID